MHDVHFDAATRMELLASHHVREVPQRQGMVLVLAATGMDDSEVAAALGLTENTVHNHAANVRARVVPPLLHPTRANASAWAWLHRNCCLATPFAGLWMRPRAANGNGSVIAAT